MFQGNWCKYEYAQEPEGQLCRLFESRKSARVDQKEKTVLIQKDQFKKMVPAITD